MYGPPVATTRLPTAEKHRAIGMTAMAPAISASGASAPICVESAAGMRKMPPPTITLITAAVSAKVPTARMRAASPEIAPCAGWLRWSIEPLPIDCPSVARLRAECESPPNCVPFRACRLVRAV